MAQTTVKLLRKPKIVERGWRYVVYQVRYQKGFIRDKVWKQIKFTYAKINQLPKHEEVRMRRIIKRLGLPISRCEFEVAYPEYKYAYPALKAKIRRLAERKGLPPVEAAKKAIYDDFLAREAARSTGKHRRIK